MIWKGKKRTNCITLIILHLDWLQLKIILFNQTKHSLQGQTRNRISLPIHSKKCFQIRLETAWFRWREKKLAEANSPISFYLQKNMRGALRHLAAAKIHWSSWKSLLQEKVHLKYESKEKLMGVTNISIQLI